MTENPQVGSHKTVRVAIKSRVLLDLSVRSMAPEDCPTLSDTSKKKEVLLEIYRRMWVSPSDRVPESFLLEGNRGPCGLDRE